MAKIPIIMGLIFAVIFVAPLGYLIWYYGSISSLLSIFSSRGFPSELWSTIYPAGIGAGIAVFDATIYAWIVHRTDIPGKRIMSILPFLGLAIPAVLRGIGFVFLFSPSTGLINLAFMRIFDVKFPLFNIFSNSGLILAHATGAFPFSYIVMSAIIRGMDSSFEDSARVAGSRVLTTLRRVTVPFLAPAIVTTFVLGFVYSAANFDYPFIFGSVSSSGIKTLATGVYDSISEQLPPSYHAATALSIVYLMITLTAMTVYIWLVTRNSVRFSALQSTRERRTTYGLGRWRYLAIAICLFIVIISVYLLAFILFLVSLLPFYSWQSGILSELTLSNYQSLFFGSSYASTFWNAFENSIIVSLVTASLTAILGAFLAYAALKTRLRTSKFLEYFNSIPFGVPGVVFGFALLIVFLRVPLLSSLYGTIWPLIIGLTITWTAFSIRIQAPSILQLPQEVEESAGVAGAKWFRMFRTVMIPMLKVSILVSFAYVFMDSFRELGTVYLLTTPSSYLLTTFIADLYTSSGASLPIVAAIASVMTAFLAAFLVIVNRAVGGRLLSDRD
ncbi:MAG: ABC transporter permease [Nitrososphaerales archaeon]